MTFTEHSDVVAFLKGSGEEDVLNSYEELRDCVSSDYVLKPEMDLYTTDGIVHYEIHVRNPATQNGQRSGKGTQILSHLLGRKDTYSWPQKFYGTVSRGNLPKAYRDQIESKSVKREEAISSLLSGGERVSKGKMRDE